MFSIFKKAPIEQEVVLQDLTEEQLTQAAGGQAKARDWDSNKKWVQHHHHHHHHHHSGSHMKWSNTKTKAKSNATVFTGHF